MAAIRLPRPAAARAATGKRRVNSLDLILPPILFVLTLALRYPYRIGLPYAWDSLLYMRAMDHFDPVIHQPQPPGYLFYVWTAKLLEFGAHGHNAALVWVSMLSSGVAVAGLYLLARSLYDRATGLIAALFLLTSGTFWFYGEVAYPYTTLAAGSVILALLALAVRRRVLGGWWGAALAGLAFGLLTGFRQDLLLFLAPLYLVALWGRPPRDWLAALLAGICGVLAWLLPSAALSGGMARYLHATFRQVGMVNSDTSVESHGLSAFATNGHELAVFLWHGLYLAVLPLVYQLARWVVRRRPADPARNWLLLWLAPPLAFYILVHIGDYGYTFSILPALLVIAARGTVNAARDLVSGIRRIASGPDRTRPAYANLALSLGLAVVLVAGNGYAFLRLPSNLGATGIRCFDATMQARINLVHDHFPPQDTLIFSSGYYQHVRYYLPEYRNWFYEPLNGPVDRHVIDPPTRTLVVFDELIQPAPGEMGFEHYSLPCTGKPFYYARVKPGDILRFDQRQNTLSIQPGT